MNWELIQEIGLWIGSVLGGGWLINLYKARPEKNAIEIKNMQSILATQQELLDKFEKRLDDRDEVIEELKRRVDLKHEVIFSAYGCRLVKMPEDCVVIKQWHEKCEHCEHNDEVTD